jgi:apolipoprotein D and lipocalin family protein
MERIMSKLFSMISIFGVSLFLFTSTQDQAHAMSHKDTKPPVRTVDYVDLKQYMGLWYEISSFPQSFQKGCRNTTAQYTLQENGKVEVINSCDRNGKRSVAKGKAKVADKATNAKLKVSFFGPFYGDYWVLELGQVFENKYEYAVVGDPTRQYLWILSRTETMSEEVYTGITSRLLEQGYEIDRLVKTRD